MSNHFLSDEQKAFYKKNGYLLGLPAIYTPSEMAAMNAELPQLLALLRPDETAKDIREWHETSRYLYDIVMNPKIHDLVEGSSGPIFSSGAAAFSSRRRTASPLSAGTRMPTIGR
jgi:hypothetical protein